MYVFFGNAMLADSTYASLIGGNLIYFIIVGLAGINFVIELILNVVLCPLLGKALYSTKFFNQSK